MGGWKGSEGERETERGKGGVVVVGGDGCSTSVNPKELSLETVSSVCLCRGKPFTEKKRERERDMFHI